jgi:hypothetical protein
MASLDDVSLIHEDEISTPVDVLRLRSGGEKQFVILPAFSLRMRGEVAGGAAIDFGTL